MWTDLSEWAKPGRYCVHLSTHQRVISAEEDFHDLVDR